MAVVYLHRKKDNNDIFYVGIGMKPHRAYSSQYRNEHWHNVVKKHGFIVEFVEKDIDWETCKIKEKQLIKLYGRITNGGILVNQTEGGEGVRGYKHTEEWKLQNSLRNKGKIIPEYQKEAIRNYMRDRVVSEETRKKISATLKRLYPAAPKIPKSKKENLVWITKDQKNTKIDKNKIQQYIDAGWKRGRYILQNTKNVMSKKGAIWMNNGINEKMILQVDIEMYAANGWIKGRNSK